MTYAASEKTLNAPIVMGPSFQIPKFWPMGEFFFFFPENIYKKVFQK